MLTDFRSRRDPLRPRSEYVACLAQDFADYYGYNRELVDLFMSLFSPAEALQWFEANEQPRPVVIRVNTLKTRCVPDATRDCALAHRMQLVVTTDVPAVPFRPSGHGERALTVQSSNSEPLAAARGVRLL